jgi:hypothetical protein
VEYFFILIVLAMVFAFGLILRFLRYRETLALAERGLIRPRSGNGHESLRWGLVMTFLGVATMVGVYPLGWVVADGMFPLNFGPWMLLGLVPAAFGLALLTIYALTRHDGARGAESEVDGPPIAGASVDEAAGDV